MKKQNGKRFFDGESFIEKTFQGNSNESEKSVFYRKGMNLVNKQIFFDNFIKSRQKLKIKGLVNYLVNCICF